MADGQGYESDSGAKGHRGYHEEMMFVWIGAAVDIPYKVHKLLGTLGPKLYFFRLPRVEETEDYYHKNRNENFAKKQEIRIALLEYLAYFEMNLDIVMEEEYEDGVLVDLPKIALEPDKDGELADRIIIRLAKLLAHLRAIVPTWETRDTQGSEYAYSLAKIEDPSRAITQLRNLAKGHALSKGRKYFTLDDIPIVIQTALSTATIERVRIFELLIGNKGSLTTSQIVDFLNTTKPTALRTMAELKATGLVDMVTGDERVSSEISLKAEFDWFLSYQFADLKQRKENCPPPREEPTSLQPSLSLYDYTINQKVLSCSREGEISLRQEPLEIQSKHYEKPVSKECPVLSSETNTIVKKIDLNSDDNDNVIRDVFTSTQSNSVVQLLEQPQKENSKKEKVNYYTKAVQSSTDPSSAETTRFLDNLREDYYEYQCSNCHYKEAVWKNNAKPKFCTRCKTPSTEE